MRHSATVETCFCDACRSLRQRLWVRSKPKLTDLLASLDCLSLSSTFTAMSFSTTGTSHETSSTLAVRPAIPRQRKRHGTVCNNCRRLRQGGCDEKKPCNNCKAPKSRSRPSRAETCDGGPKGASSQRQDATASFETRSGATAVSPGDVNTSAGLSGSHPEIHSRYSDTHTASGSSHDHLSTESATLPWSSPAPSWASSRDQAHIGRASSFGEDLGSPQAVKPPGSLLTQPLTIQDAGSGEVPPISVPALVCEGSMDVQAGGGR